MDMRTERRPAVHDLVAELATVPVLGAAHRRTQRRLAATADQLTVADGTVVLQAGQAVRWITVVLDGALRSLAHTATAGPGALVGVAEALRHGVAPTTLVADGSCRLAFIEVRALTAAVSTDPVLGLALARHLAQPSDDARGAPRRHHRFERRRSALASTRAARA